MQNLLRNIILIGAFVLSLTVIALAVHAEQNPSEQLNQLIADLQKNPADFALREKIIKIVQGMTPQPAIPQEAKQPFVKGITFMKEAKSVSDYELAITAFKEALVIVPWWPEDYYNLALAQESAGRFDDGIRSLKLYLLTNPKDAEEAQNRIYVMEAKKEKAAKDAVVAAQEKENKKKQEFELWLKKLDGGRWRDPDWRPNICVGQYLEIHGNEISFVQEPNDMSTPNCRSSPRRVAWKATIQSLPIFTVDNQYLNVSYTFRISENGETLTQIRAYYKKEGLAKEINRVYRRVGPHF